MATPEHARDVATLAELCTASGHAARLDGERVRVQAPEDWAAELNRRAMSAGITLRGLQFELRSLEEVFFSITEPVDDKDR